MRAEDLPPPIATAIDDAGLTPFLGSDYHICGLSQDGSGSPYFMISHIVGGRPHKEVRPLDVFRPPSFSGDGVDLVSFWRRAMGGRDPDATPPRITGLDDSDLPGLGSMSPERAAVLRNETARMIHQYGSMASTILEEVERVLSVLVLEFQVVDAERNERLGDSILILPPQSLFEDRGRWAGGRIHNGWDMVTSGASAEEVDDYLNTLVEWVGVNTDLLHAQRHGVQTELGRLDPIRGRIAALIARWDALNGYLKGAALGITGAGKGVDTATHDDEKPQISLPYEDEAGAWDFSPNALWLPYGKTVMNAEVENRLAKRRGAERWEHIHERLIRKHGKSLEERGLRAKDLGKDALSGIKAKHNEGAYR